MAYRAPVEDLIFTLKHAAGFAAARADGLYEDLGDDLLEAVLGEAGRFASEVLAPLNVPGDRHGTPFRDGEVTTPPGWKEAYRDWAAAGWNGVAAPAEWGGQNLPRAVNAACLEMWNAAAMAFGIGPVLTMAAVDSLAAFGSEELKKTYLPKLVSGEWMGTMQLTEPQAGSDVGALRTRAERAGDGSYRITGSKIFITYGEHDFTENIIHFVLARVAGAPDGTKGLSLFLIPKFLVGPDGKLGARNDLRADRIEHKLGLHASPTCHMVYGDHGSCVGYLVGEENRGMASMFTMMNEARLAVGLQGVAIAEAATQQALAYAGERRQGRAPGMAPTESLPIIVHVDVRRMLLTMRALTRAARAICYATAVALDRSHLAGDAAGRKAAHERAALLTPIAKAFSTDIGTEVASLGIQVHGGMGFIEETGAAQHYRDARITQIYEGTNGIQAIDLVTRKVPLSGGAAVRGYIDELRHTVDAVKAANDPAFGATAERLAEATDSLAQATEWVLAALATGPDAALAGATIYLRLFASAAGGCMLAAEALAAARGDDLGDGGADKSGRIAIARFFAENFAAQAPALASIVTESAGSVLAANAAIGAS
ncbi:MAG TPA: acyl-CoA dehydrogenase [Xanthobacteraceae bacterium]|nr:acyl-CoA dehydrogenase [Xanthobacteraceae bacterium]